MLLTADSEIENICRTTSLEMFRLSPTDSNCLKWQYSEKRISEWLNFPGGQPCKDKNSCGPYWRSEYDAQRGSLTEYIHGLSVQSRSCGQWCTFRVSTIQIAPFCIASLKKGPTVRLLRNIFLVNFRKRFRNLWMSDEIKYFCWKGKMFAE